MDVRGRPAGGLVQLRRRRVPREGGVGQAPLCLLPKQIQVVPRLGVIGRQGQHVAHRPLGRVRVRALPQQDVGEDDARGDLPGKWAAAPSRNARAAANSRRASRSRPTQQRRLQRPGPGEPFQPPGRLLE